MSWALIGNALIATNSSTDPPPVGAVNTTSISPMLLSDGSGNYWLFRINVG